MKLKYRTNNYKNMNFVPFILIVVITCLMSVGYAALKRELKIDGTANVSATSWDVRFENIAVTSGSVTPTQAAAISNNTTVNFNVTLVKPGDFYEFKVDVKNNGTLDAMIGSIVKTPNLTDAQAKYLGYTATYSGGGPVEVKDKITAGQSQTILIRVEYKLGVSSSDLPATSPSPFNMVYTLNFIQADGTAKNPTLTA